MKIAHDGARAEFRPERGGLLTDLVLMGKDGPRTLMKSSPSLGLAENTWPGCGMPVLFPFAGRVWHQGVLGFYEWGGVVRPMSLHGFAFQQPWSVLDQGAAQCTLRLNDCAALHSMYPYSFTLDVRYVLEKSKLAVTFDFVNRGALGGAPDSAPIACGFHPYFLGADGGGSLHTAEYTLDCKAFKRIEVTPEGGAGRELPLFAEEPKNQILPRSRDSLPASQGLSLDLPWLRNAILGDFGVSTARNGQVAELRIHRHGQPWMSMIWDFSIFDYAVLWEEPGGKQSCFEPWMGLPDAVHRGSGLRVVETGRTLKGTFSLEVA